jgi:hypothetical protein
MTDVANTIFEKIVIGLVVTILSTMVLLGYNSYNRTFEAAQAEARPLSTLFVKLRDNVIETSFKSVNEVRSIFTSGVPTLDPKNKEVKKLRDRAAEIERLSILFKGKADKAYQAGIGLSVAILSWLTQFEEASQFNRSNIKKFDEVITQKTIEFIAAYNDQYSGLVSGEFRSFFDKYYEQVPFYANPTWLLIAAFVALILSASVLVVMRTRANT